MGIARAGEKTGEALGLYLLLGLLDNLRLCEF